MLSVTSTRSSRARRGAPSRFLRLLDLVSCRRCVGVLAMVLVMGSSAIAEVRHLEVVGAIAMDAKTRRSGIPKDQAIEQALWEGVSRVAADLLVDSELPESEPESNPVRTALGSDVVLYTRSFRILEDQGERPALFSESQDAATEYVVVVEVKVDVDRVRERLQRVGLLQLDGAASELLGIRIEVQGLTKYEGYEELLALLMDERVGGASVIPSEFERGRSVLRVEAECGASELLERMLASAPAGLGITALAVEGSESWKPQGLSVWRTRPESLVLAVSWEPPPDPDAVTLDEGWGGE